MQILPGLYALGDSSGGYVRSYLIDDGNGLILIDTLLDKTGKLVLEELAKIGKKPSDVKSIIQTHAHQSHFGGLAALKKATGARVYSHAWEADILAGRKKVQVPPTTTLWPQKPLKIYYLQVAFVLGLGVPPPCEVDENLKDGDHIGPLTVMGAPGHTPGSITFYWPEKKALIAGDIVVTWPEVALGWPQITLDNKQNRESVGKLCDMVHAEVLCVGHGDPIIRGAADTMKDLVAGRPTKPDLAKS
ncbi:MBL fold metallo-hydrolase [Paludibaculum fermentans]|uniref:MBL fold metallo-hydrolase n=1 Tax=Paludibaculum fermentans TaxID=1473598 RepID=A0A7S7SMU3_PALFE|nr:MBL fold metallo-hydrolase [Paludibaculum fermentans]QOY89856.1 MBL fold metallo-hydrolase [Paludibaculum fermentans]